MLVNALPAGYGPGRLELQRIATHILARARLLASGRFGLRVTYSGIGTPPFGPDDELVRISGEVLMRDLHRDGVTRTRTMTVEGHSLEELASFVGIDLELPIDVGRAAPSIGDVAAPIAVSRDAFTAVFDWYRLGALACDRALSLVADPSIIQLWPEHFDVAFDGQVAGERLNFGASPGDEARPEPYLYVGPWGSQRPGDPAYWNASFGAVLDHASLVGADDPVDVALAFFRRGLEQFR